MSQTIQIIEPANNEYPLLNNKAAGYIFFNAAERVLSAGIQGVDMAEVEGSNEGLAWENNGFVWEIPAELNRKQIVDILFLVSSYIRKMMPEISLEDGDVFLTADGEKTIVALTDRIEKKVKSLRINRKAVEEARAALLEEKEMEIKEINTKEFSEEARQDFVQGWIDADGYLGDQESPCPWCMPWYAGSGIIKVTGQTPYEMGAAWWEANREEIEEELEKEVELEEEE